MRCEDCPVAAGKSCLGEKVARFCVLKRTDESYRQYLIDYVEPPPQSEPSLMARATTFAKAVVDHVAAGLPTVDSATVNGRLAICRGCEHFEAETSKCGRCTCYMPMKVTWAEQQCPIGKWEAVARKRE
jgi:hypothetical protein